MVAGKIKEVQMKVCFKIYLIKDKNINHEIRKDFKTNDKLLLSIRAFLRKQTNLRTNKNNMLEFHMYPISTPCNLCTQDKKIILFVTSTCGKP